MELAFWRDVSIVWLAFLCLIGQSIPLVALYFVVRGMAAAHRGTVSLFGQGQRYSKIMRQQSERLSGQVSQPLIRVSGQGARWRTVMRRLWPNRS